MPLSVLEDSCALVLIDLQKGIAGGPMSQAAQPVVQNAARLAAAFRAKGKVVVLVHVTGAASGRTDIQRPKAPMPADWTELLPELGQASSDVVIAKQRWGAFTGTELDKTLRARGVTQVVLGGISTSIGVETTARSAYELGYSVALVVDAMTDREPDLHKHSVERIFPKLGEVTRTNEVLGKLG